MTFLIKEYFLKFDHLTEVLGGNVRVSGFNHNCKLFNVITVTEKIERTLYTSIKRVWNKKQNEQKQKQYKNKLIKWKLKEKLWKLL